jgi:WD40 repeat protein
VIQVISVVEGEVISQLHGHTSSVTDLSAPTTSNCPAQLLSLSADGNLRLWNVVQCTCLCSLSANAVSAVMSQQGTCFYTGHKGGKISCWEIPGLTGPSHHHGHTDGPAGHTVITLEPVRSQLALEGGLTDTVDCLKLLPGETSLVCLCTTASCCCFKEQQTRFMVSNHRSSMPYLLAVVHPNLLVSTCRQQARSQVM